MELLFALGHEDTTHISYYTWVNNLRFLFAFDSGWGLAEKRKRDTQKFMIPRWRRRIIAGPSLMAEIVEVCRASVETSWLRLAVCLPPSEDCRMNEFAYSSTIFVPA
jgi:hypothetical protein